MASRAPSTPGIRLEVTSDYTASSKCDEGYLRVRRRKMVARHPGRAEPSEEFKYDAVERWNQDAVAIVLHFVRDGRRHVILRSAVRPPLALRPNPLIAIAIPFPDGVTHGELWEIPAGLVEDKERTPEGLVACAARETFEEVGLTVDVGAVRPLGGAIFPSAGIIGECIYLFEAEVDVHDRPEPKGDGPLEQGARIHEVALDEAIRWCDEGQLPDVKTEIALRRLAARVPA